MSTAVHTHTHTHTHAHKRQVFLSIQGRRDPKPAQESVRGWRDERRSKEKVNREEQTEKRRKSKKS